MNDSPRTPILCWLLYISVAVDIALALVIGWPFVEQARATPAFIAPLIGVAVGCSVVIFVKLGVAQILNAVTATAHYAKLSYESRESVSAKSSWPR